MARAGRGKLPPVDEPVLLELTYDEARVLRGLVGNTGFPGLIEFIRMSGEPCTDMSSYRVREHLVAIRDALDPLTRAKKV